MEQAPDRQSLTREKVAEDSQRWLGLDTLSTFVKAIEADRDYHLVNRPETD